MDLGISGKTAFISGSTAGIGLAIAEGLAGEGARVIINGRTDERVDKAVSDIKARIGDANVVGIAADAGTADGAAKIVRELPQVDILINNLGIYEIKDFVDITDEDWFRTFEVNVMSGIRLSRSYFPKMLSSNWGRIVFISSESGINIPVEMIQYGMTKTAQFAVARGLAELTVGTGVTVNTVLPGPTRSEGVATFLEEIAKKEGKDVSIIEKGVFENLRPSSLIKRFATPQEVANMVIYLCSTAASATNGAALRVDGGVIRSIV
jgi:NAD(P)-dependent dehydrogenase (short-subunit alcohol dehydrogenase family)